MSNNSDFDIDKPSPDTLAGINVFFDSGEPDTVAKNKPNVGPREYPTSEQLAGIYVCFDGKEITPTPPSP